MSGQGSQDYVEMVQRIIAGEAVTMSQFISHIETQNRGASLGLPIGDLMPEFALVDQTGASRTRATLTGPKALLMVFVRTVNWCGYCRNQLAEINLAAPELRKRGIEVVALAPDDLTLIAKFAEFAALDYALLADEGAEFAERIGILNPNIPVESTTQNGGRVPFPGHYLLNASGRIIAAEFTDDLRHRISATTLVFEHFEGERDAPAITLKADQLTLRLEFATLRVQTGQEISYAATLDIDSNWHVYGTGVPPPYQPLAIEFDGRLIDFHRIEFARPPETPLDGRDELPEYSGQLKARGRIRLAWSPPVHGSRLITGLAESLQERQTLPGKHTLSGRLVYQACGDGVCMPPVQRVFEVPIDIESDIDKVAAVFRAEAIRSSDNA